MFRVSKNTNENEAGLLIHLKSSFELIWSNVVHLILLDMVRSVKKLATKKSINTTSDGTRDWSLCTISIISEHPMEFGFRLPRDHM